jgi:hypothetical protein
MPYASKAQAAFFNMHRKQLEKQGVNVAEWNAASKGKKLPGHAKGSSVLSRAAQRSKRR